MKNYLKFNFKHLALLMLVSVVTISVTFLLLFKNVENLIHQSSMNTIQKDIELRVEKVNDFFVRSELIVQTLASKNLLHDFIRSKYKKRYEQELQEAYLTTSTINPIIMQLRFLDKEGTERIRVDREQGQNAKAFIVTGAILQNKHSRYYCKEVEKLKKGQIWYSSLDLNVEKGKIEIPFRPTLRIATPVYIDDQYEGMVIVNLHMKSFLETLRGSALYDFYLINSQGDIILHKDPSLDWMPYIKGTGRTLQKEFPNSWQEILREEAFSNGVLYSHKIKFLNDNKYMTLVSEVKPSIYNGNKNRAIWQILPLFVLVIFAFAFIVSSIIFNRVNLFKAKTTSKINSQNETISEQNELLIKQSRQAARGETLSIIAHQWKQPLSVLAAMCTNLSLKSSMGTVTNEETFESCSQMNDEIIHLGQTINDFREYFKPKEEKALFNIKKTFQTTQTLLDPLLSESAIELKIDTDEIDIESVENELQQVLISVVKNARDAIVENAVKNGLITIDAKVQEDTVQILICDNGGGIPEENLDKVTELYFSTKGLNGTGLGLYVCNAIVTKHLNGTFSIYNKNEGVCFEMNLPL